MSALGIGGEAILLLLVALNLAATAIIVIAARQDHHERSRQELVDVETMARSELTTALSVIVPAHDHAGEIVSSVRALLAASYPTLEVIVVDDGSEDGTIDALRRAFALVQVDRVPRTRLRTGRVTGAYASPLDARLLVLAKEAAGRADALNTGLRFARYPLVCPIDPLLALDRDALVLLARPFQTDATTIACGASTRLAVTSGSPLVRLRALARMRTALVARVAAGRLGGALLGPGAIRLFSREIVVAAGGYDATAAREDRELVLRLRRHTRVGGLSHRMVSLPRSVACAPAAVAGPVQRGPLALISLVGSAMAGIALAGVAPAAILIDCVLLVSAPAGLSLAASLLDRPHPGRATPVHEPTRRIGPGRRPSKPLGDPEATLIG
jgi:cellulose synthase/poly-beta-1,6-N-acetylglucosamine synthase-like glycosyltransferase